MLYTAQLTIDRIQSLIKEKGYTQKKVFSECGIGEDTVKRMKNNKGISSFYLAKIADYLECSVDYLLGRTDSPAIEKNVKQNDNHGLNMGINAVELSVPVTIPPQELDENQAELLKYFGMLSYEEKLNFMQTLIKQAKEQQK